MNEYIDVFKIEAKGLLKDFKKNDEKAVARCAKYFSGHRDLSLMNAQHVIAKEYGFDSWDDIVKCENWQLAEALNLAKDRSLTSSLFYYKSLKDKNIFCSLADKCNISPHKPRSGMDFTTFTEKFPNGNVMEIFQIDGTDVSEYDLSGLDISKTVFDDWTVWPSDETKMPKGINPAEFKEKRKNIGLGIRSLHKRGIDGRGRNVAIIDSAAVVNHLDYRDNLADYIDLTGDENSGGLGGERLSVLVGKNCGILPKAKAYYIRVRVYNEEKKPIQTGYANALEKICDIHQELVAGGKNGIDVVWIAGGLMLDIFAKEEGHEKFVKAYERATNLGIWVNMVGSEPEEKHKPIIGVGCKADGDLDNPYDYKKIGSSVSLPKNIEAYIKENGPFLAIPAGCRTVAGHDKLDAYRYIGFGYFGFSVISGFYVMAKSVKEDITPQEFWKLMYSTGDEIFDGIAVLISPVKLIDALKG